MFTILMLMAIVSSLVSPLALRWILHHITPNEEEQTRLIKEQAAKGSPIQNITRILIPLRRRENSESLDNIQTIKSVLVTRLAKNNSKLSITLLNIDKTENKEKNLNFLNFTTGSFSGTDVKTKFVDSSKPDEAILDEAAKDYNLLLLGASQQLSNRHHLFSSVIDSIIKLSPCTTVIVHCKNLPPDWTPSKILVPTNGSAAAKHAAELSFLLAANPNHEVTVLRVIEETQYHLLHHENDPHLKNQRMITQRMVEDLAKMGEAHQINVNRSIKSGSVEEQIIQTAQQKKCDLIILSTSVRPASSRLFLGPRVERILQLAPCPVLILNTIS